MVKAHSFHFSDIGIGFYIDTEIIAAHYGIDSITFKGYEVLLKKIRTQYCETFNLVLVLFQ